MKRFSVFMFCIFSCFDTAAFAQSRSHSSTPSANVVYFDETFFPVYVSKNDAEWQEIGGSADSNVPTEQGWGFDARTTAGYVWDGFLFALTYNYYSVQTSRPATDTWDSKKTTTTKTEFGPTLGYFLGSWRFALTYFISADKTYSQKDVLPSGTLSTDETWKNTGGSGYQLAVGYDFVLGSGFGISPTLAYRQVSYSKQSLDVRAGSDTPYGTTSLVTKAIDHDLKPMVTVSYRF